MKIKNKKNIFKWLGTMGVAIFFIAVTFSQAEAASAQLVPCICKETADSLQRTATIYVAAEADCDQKCANTYGTNAVYALGLDGGAYKLVTKTPGGIADVARHTCSCSSTPPYDSAITGTSSATDEDNCISQCRGYDSKVYQYDTNAWKDVPPASSATSTTSTEKEYELLESFPGFFDAKTKMNTSTSNDFPAMILAIYKFGIWTVGIAGLFMLVVGGFTYMTSAGNNSTAGNAKKIITDSILGIVAALGAYLILYVINPELTKIKIDFTAVDVTEGTPMGPTIAAGSPGACAQLTSGSCAVTSTDLVTAFGANAGKASSICNGESTGIADLVSRADKCSDGKAFSVGLFQINMIDSATSIGCNTNGEIFDTGRSKGSCLERNSSNTCIKWSCKVKNQSAYDACLSKLKDPSTNIAIAKNLSRNGTTWTRWGANKSFGCNF